MAIVSTTLETQAAFLSAPDAQILTTLTSRAQSAIVEIKFEDESGLCKDATREVRFVTAVPLMANRLDYSPYNLFFRGIDVRADREKRTGKMLERILNSGELVITVEQLDWV